jgi:phenylacetate-CoA ligase
LSRDILEERQWNRFKKLIRFAYDMNVFYRKRFDDAGVRPEDIRSIEDIRALPILTKEDIRRETDEMISRGFIKDTLMKIKTGGSTGTALELYITEECSEFRNACARRSDQWSGWKPCEPVGAVWGNPILPSGVKSRMRSFLLGPYIFLDTMNITDNSVLRFSGDWERVRPTLLYGHAHSIFILAEYVKKLSVDVIRPRSIVSTSMMLLAHERKTIEQVFGVKVTDRYGCEEVSLIASECERHEGMHMNIEHLLIEFIKEDGEPAAPGEMGTIVVTDLMNYAMPLIRYRVEDMGMPTDRICKCGRGLPLMDKVLGRTADFLVRKDGSRVAGVSLIERLLTNNPGICQMQIVQETIDHFHVSIVKGDKFIQDTTIPQFLNDLREIFPDTEIVVEYAGHIKPEISGKYRFAICKLKI